MSRGTRQTTTEPHDENNSDPCGKLPDGFVGADIVQSQFDFAGVLARFALTDDSEEEVRNVNAIKDRITAMLGKLAVSRAFSVQNQG